MNFWYKFSNFSIDSCRVSISGHPFQQTDLCNLQLNAGVHKDNSEDYEEDGQITSSEEEESTTPSKNENDPNDHQHYPGNEINQEDELKEYELEGEYHEELEDKDVGVTLENNEDRNTNEKVEVS